MPKRPSNPPETAADRARDAEIVKRILDREESAFNELVAQHYPGMLRLARGFLTSAASAEEVVQESWVGILKGLHRFEGRSSLKTWMFRILVNRCITRRKKDGRSIPFSSMNLGDEDDSAVDPSRFRGRGMWAQPPQQWELNTPEKILATRQALATVESALESLPERQRIVVHLRDIQGWSSGDVCNALEISESNQRVLLHRGRSKVRAALEAADREMTGNSDS